MRHTTLIVPGFHGSGPEHWQTWLEQRLPDARRVRGIDWEAPVLARWAAAVRREIDESPHSVWLVAHSFGCLASVVAAADRPERVAGALLVAPADPARFGPLGLQEETPGPIDDLGPWLPQGQLGFPCAVIASTNDPWVRLTVAAYWADRWGARFINIGAAGHINVDSGFGAWPFCHDLLAGMQQAHEDLPLGSISGRRESHKGRRSALARLRHHTRNSLELRPGDPD
ncbi:alpha/beta hydrolase [Azoarcus sp. DN11]|uniref:RBBP9/YdeN family alpha/beta hydrolase n=1 Tax=Azoarcus sp. DN11 TaxID=356837 RepID=UPI000EB0091F|nr:alpha/beta hydrolase [Azoarcus sp. DN11]AYH42924.1 esterase [Azoarcus sp. DN11]